MNALNWVIFIYTIVLVVLAFGPARETVWFVDAIKVFILLLAYWFIKATSGH